MTSRERRKILYELRELGVEVRVPDKATYMREIYRNHKLQRFLDDWEKEKRRRRKRAEELIKL